MTKTDLKLVAKLYLASMAIELDSGFLAEEVGLTEKELEYFTAYLNDMGRKMLKQHPHQSGLKSIVDYVYTEFYD